MAFFILILTTSVLGWVPDDILQVSKDANQTIKEICMDSLNFTEQEKDQFWTNINTVVATDGGLEKVGWVAL